MSIADNQRQIDQWLANPPSDWKAKFRSGFSKLRRGPGDLTRVNALRVLGITAGGRPSGDSAVGQNRVPEAVRDAAMHGLKLSWQNNYGAWDFIGIARGIQLATMAGVPDETVVRMKAYFSWHQKDKNSANFGNDGHPSRGYMAYLNWGGDAGERWVNSMMGRANTGSPGGKHVLGKLPYPYDALEPYLSARTLHFHHDKHHQAYVDGLNRAEEALCRALADGKWTEAQRINQDQAFNWGGDFLHQLYWHCLTPNYTPPSPAFVERIVKSFGSWKAFRQYLKASTIQIKGSGWGALVAFPDGSLRVGSIYNHENNVLYNKRILLVIDIWEHAYYLDYQNDRSKYFDVVFDHLINWPFVENRLREVR